MGEGICPPLQSVTLLLFIILETIIDSVKTEMISVL